MLLVLLLVIFKNYEKNQTTPNATTTQILNTQGAKYTTRGVGFLASVHAF